MPRNRIKVPRIEVNKPSDRIRPSALEADDFAVSTATYAGTPQSAIRIQYRNVAVGGRIGTRSTTAPLESVKLVTL